MKTKIVLSSLFFALMSGAALAGDAQVGEKIVKTRCAACHTVNSGGANKVGPNLFGVTTRGPGKVPGFKYSPLLIQASSGISWRDSELDGYLKDPTQFLMAKTNQAGVGASKMTFKLPNASDRADVISYLQTLK